MSRRFIINVAALALGMSVVRSAFAQRSIDIGFGIDGTFMGVFNNLITFLSGSIIAVCIAVFLVGAFFMTLSRGKDDQVKKGKDMMVHALEGLAVVLGSYGIIRMALYVFY